MDSIEWVLVFENLEIALKNFPINESKLIRIGDKKICLSRLHDGFFAIDDTCPHLGASLSMGRCKANGVIECPWHHYLFNVKTGRNIGGTDNDLAIHRVKTEGNQLFIGI